MMRVYDNTPIMIPGYITKSKFATVRMVMMMAEVMKTRGYNIVEL